MFVILGHYLPFQTPDNPENQNFKIEKKTFYYFTILLQICTISDNHIMYGSWSATDRMFCHSGPFFALSPSYGPKKNQNFEKMKYTIVYYRFINEYHK